MSLISDLRFWENALALYNSPHYKDDMSRQDLYGSCLRAQRRTAESKIDTLKLLINKNQNPKMNEARAWINEYFEVNGFSDEVAEDNDSLKDLGMDSLDKIQMGISLEEKLEVTIPDSEMEGWKTVGDVVLTYKSYNNGK